MSRGTIPCRICKLIDLGLVIQLNTLDLLVTVCVHPWQVEEGRIRVNLVESTDHSVLVEIKEVTKPYEPKEMWFEKTDYIPL